MSNDSERTRVQAGDSIETQVVGERNEKTVNFGSKLRMHLTHWFRLHQVDNEIQNQTFPQ